MTEYTLTGGNLELKKIAEKVEVSYSTKNLKKKKKEQKKYI